MISYNDIEYDETLPLTYIKVINNEVRAFDLLACITAEKEYKTGKLYDKVVTDEEWAKNDYTARLIDNKIILGKDPQDKLQDNSDYIRSWRDRYLSVCDKISPMRWNSMSDTEKQAWTDYRQALLDITDQPGFPWDGDVDKAPWPVKPS